jgi:DNA recombination protein RmuC
MDPLSSALISLIVGILLGTLLGWLLGQRRSMSSSNTEPLLAELRHQLSQRDLALAQLREESAQIRSSIATAQAGQDSAQQLLAEERRLHERQLADARELQSKALNDLRDAFKALSADALKQTQPEFLRLANETFAKFAETAKGDLGQRHQAIATLLEPVRQQLETYQRRLQQSESAQSIALGEVKRHLESLTHQSQSLSNETLQLRRVLSSNQARGRWGEETLRRVVEAAGMSAHCDFSEQAQAGEGKPDLIVRLPANRVIIVDAKVPDLDFLTALDSADPQTRGDALATHATRLKQTIKALADRDYPRLFPNALDYVVLFLPAESLFSAALEGDRDLIVWAAQRRILLATPASLIALLRSVSVSWQQQAQTDNARAIADAATELYARVAKFTEHLEKIRTGLDRATASFNDAVGSYERMVRPAGDRLQRLQGDLSGRQLADVLPIDTSLRLVDRGNSPSPNPDQNLELGKPDPAT